MQSQPRTPLTIQVDHGEQATVVHLAGAATIDEADRLSKQLREIAGEPTTRRIVLDLSALEFICSMGLGALIVAHVTGQRRDREVVIAGPQPAIRDMLRTTRLDRIFPVFGDVGSAVH